MSDRTPLQEIAQVVWESLLDAQGHISDMRHVDGAQDAAYEVEYELEQVFEKLSKYMHEDDCHD